MKYNECESYPSDDLKANFRSWEDQENSEDDAEELTGILISRHPDYNEQSLKEMAYHWCGVDTAEEKEYKEDYVYHGRSESHE